MPQIELNDELFQAASRRAIDGGYPNVDAYITDIVVHDLTDQGAPTPNLDHLFTPDIISELSKISNTVEAGAKTYTTLQVLQHFEHKSAGWRKSASE